MFNRNKKWVIATSILVLLPMVVGIILWDRLPVNMAVQFSAADGSVSGYRGKEFVIFGIPCLMLFLHLMASVFTANDPKRQSMGDLMYRMLLFICPIISWFISAFSYLEGLNKEVPLATLLQIFLGMLVVLVGVLLPKCPQNPSIGFRFRSTLEDEETWKKTHLVGGMIWVIAGLIFIANAFTGIILTQFLILIVAIMVGVPYAYASRDYKSRHQDDRYEKLREELKKKEINRNNSKKKKRK